MRRILPEKYSNMKSMVRERLNKTSEVAVTTDIWTSCQSLSYCCLTAHTVSDEWKLESYVLETFNFNTDHTGKHIAQELKRVVDNWEISSISCGVTNNASNMLPGIREAGCSHVKSVVQEAIKADSTLSALQSKRKNIVSFFHRSTKASDKLRSAQDQLSLP